MNRCSRPRPDYCSIPIFPAPNSLGCCSRRRTPPTKPHAANSPSARSISYLLWRLTGGNVHATDATNASRTLLFDIHEGRWDDQLLNLLGVPKSVLPKVLNSSAAFGMSDPELFGGAIPIYGIAGDQQAALVGQACFAPGMLKATYGTGCFALLNTGSTPVKSNNKLVTTIAYQLGGRRSYALEGSIFVAGAAVQWLRDGLRIVASAAESGRSCASGGTDAGSQFWCRLSSDWARRIGGPTCAALYSA